MGLAPGGAGTAAPASPRSATGAVIRPYGGSGGVAVAPAPSGRPASGGAAVASGPLRPEDIGLSPRGLPTVTANVSNRHIHLKKEDLETLFGPGSELTPRNMLMQPFQFAAEQTVTLITGRGRSIENVRILGPLRKYSQVEISRTDAFFLGIRPPVRTSGDLKGSAGGLLVGPKGSVALKEGVIIADRHIHTPPDAAARFGLSDNQFISVRVFHTDKPTTLESVRIRISDEFLLEMHLDTDDANSTGLVNGDRVEILL